MLFFTLDILFIRTNEFANTEVNNTSLSRAFFDNLRLHLCLTKNKSAQKFAGNCSEYCRKSKQHFLHLVFVSQPNSALLTVAKLTITYYLQVKKGPFFSNIFVNLSEAISYNKSIGCLIGS